MESTKQKAIQLYESYQKLNFIDKPFHLICGICNEIFRFPQQTNCGCRFCEKCLKKFLGNETKKCPANLKDCEEISMTGFHLDTAINKEVLSLKLHCPHDPCKIIKTLIEITDHVDECEYRMVKCSMCNGDYQFKNIKKHEDKECPKKQVKCSYCKKTFTSEFYQTEHLDPDCDDLCENFSIKECPYKCSTEQFIHNLREHLKKCPKAKHKCPLSASKCPNNKFTDEELKEHFDENLLIHFNYLKEENNHFKTEINYLESSIKEMKKKMNAELKKDKVLMNGTYIYKLGSFSEKQRKAESEGPVSFTSAPFYTSEYGYKMCLKIYPAGDGVGGGTHLSVFFVIMKGDFDDVLSWPFKQKVTISLLDQEGCGKHHMETIKQEVNSVCYEKPKEDVNEPIGAPKIFELKSLLKSRFYKNDTIYVKIQIN